LKEKFPSYEEFEKYFLEVVRKLEDEEGSFFLISNIFTLHG